MKTTAFKTAWEYKQFTFSDWQPDYKWIYLATQNRFQDCQFAATRQFLWQEIQKSVMEQLQPWLNSGWQAIDEVGPEAIELVKAEKTDTRIDLADVFMWFITLGFGLIFQLFAGQITKRYLCFTPKVFSLTLRHVQHNRENELVATTLRAA